eukprot:CAMPEP_0206281478 /NCGR_PEP_ID=MMETSP0047_2-20121206/39149_1 /ASSEMBLY_ACC=CAM_ASM_000192 /TAXON_ID=195065 /ORGANISM="Chroomonas mesostigmatica_cf, Strain CCMP1168" /LENGTH=65 /DNA_ID=CAMNT_0053711641 /DNA_START=3 /DNA_END=197 /DNA_ORIENTATION=-
MAIKRAEMQAIERQLNKARLAAARAQVKLSPEEEAEQKRKAEIAKQKRYDAFDSETTPSQSTAAA